MVLFKNYWLMKNDVVRWGAYASLTQGPESLSASDAGFTGSFCFADDFEREAIYPWRFK
jgi:hypothetical protein